MSLPLPVRLLRALGRPLAAGPKTETSHNMGQAGQSSPPARSRLPAAGEDFELAPYPSARPELSAPHRRQSSIDLRIIDLPRAPAVTLSTHDHPEDYLGGRGRPERISLSPSSSRSASPAPSACSNTNSWSDSDSPDATRPRLGRQQRHTRPRHTTPEQEVEIIWRQYWD